MLNETLSALISTAGDVEDVVRQSVKLSLNSIGRHTPQQVITQICFAICTQNIYPAQKSLLMEILEKIVRENILSLKSEDIDTIIQFSMNEICLDIEVLDHKRQAVKIFAAASNLYPQLCYEEVLKRIPPQQTTSQVSFNENVIYALNEFTQRNPDFIFNRLKLIFDRIIPSFSSIKNNHQKQILSEAFGNFAEAITFVCRKGNTLEKGTHSEDNRNVYQKANQIHQLDSNSISSVIQPSNLTSSLYSIVYNLESLYGFTDSHPTNQFETEMDIVFDMLQGSWSSNFGTGGSERCRLSCLWSIGKVAKLVSSRSLSASLTKLIPLFLQYLKKDEPILRFSASVALHGVISSALKLKPQDVQPYIQQLLQVIFSTIIQLPVLNPTAFIFPPQQAKWDQLVTRIASGGEQQLLPDEMGFEEDTFDSYETNNDKKEEEQNDEQNGGLEKEIIVERQQEFILRRMEERSGIGIGVKQKIEGAKNILEPITDAAVLDTQQRTSLELHALICRIAHSYVEDTTSFILKHLDKTLGAQRAITIGIMAHMVSLLGIHIEPKKTQIFSSLSSSLNDGSLCVRFALVQLTLALSRNGILDDTNWEALIRVIIMAAGSPFGWGTTNNNLDSQQNRYYSKEDNVTQTGTNSFQNNGALLPISQYLAFEQSRFNEKRITSTGKNINLFSSQQEIDQQLTRGVPNLQTLQSFASDTLYEIIAYHTAARNQLWPCLFQYLFDPTAASSLPVVLTALLRLVISRKQRLGNRWGLMWNPHDIQTDCRITLPSLALIRVLMPGINKIFSEQTKLDEITVIDHLRCINRSRALTCSIVVISENIKQHRPFSN
ncbi:MAG: hypothetical protein EZS28_004690 [Streblomastix strix]|uniref:MROH2B-like N-terminal HEAT-repeats domain-containing protein n=1 Tax=Streblomastix strix TaxID=222440 RepID=A0A5J4X006_9EUKA|nr:MAG: hypothetical protein EZS28_004690 [Streblomastix strix]